MGRSLKCSPGQGYTGGCAVMQYVGEGPRGSNGTCSTLCRFSVTAFATHNQIGPFWCCFPGGWACACSRSLWVSPTTSPVRLGASPAAASTPTGVFTQWFEALFPCAVALGYAVCFVPPPFLPVYLCVNVGKGSEKEQGQFLYSLTVFSYFPHYPQANWALLVLIFGWMVGFCTF